MNRNFFLWYYTRGMRDAFVLWGDLSWFVAYKFHIGGLLRTFLSPWKRDVSFHAWRGLHPMLFLHMLINNFISRLLGMLVRLVILIVGSAMWLSVCVAGAVMILAYIGAPMLVFGGFVALPWTSGWGVGSVLLGGSGFLVAFAGYVLRKQDEPFTLAIEMLQHKKIFRRIADRLGFEWKTLPKEPLKDSQHWYAWLQSLGIEPSTYERAVRIEWQAALERDQRRRFWSRKHLRTTRPFGKHWHYAYTPHLDRYCVDLSISDPTEYGEAELIGRQEELRVATVVLERPVQNSVMLVGAPGIGKATLVHFLARCMRENRFGASVLDEARMLLFDIRLAENEALSHGEDVEGFLRKLFVEAAYAGNVILVVEHVDMLLGGDHSRPNLAPLLSELLQAPNFRMIGMAPTERYHELAKTDEQVLKFFDVIYLREPTLEETFDILVRQLAPLERKKVMFTVPGLEAVIAAAGRYNWETPFPERAIDLVQEVLIYWRGTAERLITPDTVDAFITLKTGVPTGVLGANEKAKLLKLEELLHQRVIGQDEAVKQVAEAMRKARAGFGDASRPLGSFIFFGPSGVGKTETVKAFAESYFGSEDNMIRLDMSEFQTKESIDRLIGSRAAGIQGRLVSAAREKPFSILLLDEIEKAYPQALDLFLQILDEGYVTDSFGEKVSFRNMVIIATSNAGAPLIKTLVEQGAPIGTIRRRVLDDIVERNLFRLEFLGRFDGIIFFSPLKPGELKQVAELKLKKFAERLKKEKNIAISFSADVVDVIVEKGFEPEFGMRSLNRFIEDTIEDVVVRKVIAGEVAAGGALTVSGNEL